MQTSTLAILLTGIIAMLVALVGFLCWRMARKNDELRHKNEVIVHEVERNLRLIDRAVSLGLSRAALLQSARSPISNQTDKFNPINTLFDILRQTDKSKKRTKTFGVIKLSPYLSSINRRQIAAPK